jgi:hypothetical protein
MSLLVVPRYANPFYAFLKHPSSFHRRVQNYKLYPMKKSSDSSVSQYDILIQLGINWKYWMRLGLMEIDFQLKTPLRQHFLTLLPVDY